jgi:hypothetical protein
MSVTILLAGKKQAVADKHIVKNLFKQLVGLDEDIRTNAKQSLINIADLPLGFEIAVSELSRDLMILDEIFSHRAVKPLTNLLPKLSSYENPPFIDEHLKPKKFKRFIKALAFLLKKYEDGVVAAVNTVNIATKLAPFLAKQYKTAKYAAKCLKKVGKRDQHNKALLLRFVKDFGDQNKLKKYVKKEFKDLLSK